MPQDKACDELRAQAAALLGALCRAGGCVLWSSAGYYADEALKAAVAGLDDAAAVSVARAAPPRCCPARVCSARHPRHPRPTTPCSRHNSSPHARPLRWRSLTWRQQRGPPTRRSQQHWTPRSGLQSGRRWRSWRAACSRRHWWSRLWTLRWLATRWVLRGVSRGSHRACVPHQLDTNSYTHTHACAHTYTHTHARARAGHHVRACAGLVQLRRQPGAHRARC
jgi:hypothetical protein